MLNHQYLTQLIIALTTISFASPIMAFPIEQQLEEVASHLVGVMDTSAQAAVNPKRAIVRMTTCKVTVTEQPDSIYLYQEQAMADKLEQPYRQRFLHIKPSADRDSIESQSYKPLQLENWINFCNKSQGDRAITMQDLGESVCSVFLKPVISIYIGETQPGGCPANFKGAVTITNQIILNSQGMDTWDKGFDANGNQVWGADDDSYQYRWLKN